MADFELLRKERKELAELTRLHAHSVLFFKAPARPWFKVKADERDKPDAVRHRTTSASCIESLGDIPPDEIITYEDASEREAPDVVNELARDFSIAALSAHARDWQSEGAADVYCRVRALPPILDLAPEAVVRTFRRKIERHVRFVWNAVRSEPRRQGIYERTTQRSGEKKQDPNYPPNAFQTYWALRLLYLCAHEPLLEPVAAEYDEARETAVLWTQNMLASQVALHNVGSSRADPNQLIWALIAQFVDVHELAEPAAGEFARRDLYEAGLKAFFAQQLENGMWPLGQPLFHYPRAGNAYCYTFETLAGLLRPALYDRAGSMLRDLLRPHLGRLLLAWHGARESQISLKADGTAVGWRSGHHPHRTKAEGWATASVFSYLQCLRKLVGTWARDEAARELGARPTRFASRTEAAQELARRGNTWRTPNRWSAGEQLAGLFLHPVAATDRRTEQLDPDLPLIRETQARSAILFGPPGTGKTTIVESLAGAIGWDFVEIHASHFLREGMDRVPSRADEIFTWLMELDHCVVLFDEIDELLRERQTSESDPFGRFLTTSMLPKLARLWEQGRVLFFVATNDIQHADRAIKRSQRFDTSIFVAPPSYEVKLREMRSRIPNLEVGNLNEGRVEVALDKDPKDDPLGYFALLRHDQLGELSDRLKESQDDPPLALQDALRDMGKALAESDWLSPEGKTAFEAFRHLQGQERRDHGRFRLVSVARRQVASIPRGMERFDVREETAYLRVTGSERPPRVIETGGARLRRGHLLEYS